MTFLDMALANLASAPVLFFLLGIAATLAGSTLSLPEGAAKMLSIYLMMAIGFKGGAALAGGEGGGHLPLILLAGLALSALMPLIGERYLRVLSRVGPIERAAIAGHYGSISIVTFVAATSALAALGIAHDPGMVAVAAAMETPAILTALILVYRARAAAGKGEGISWKPLLREVFLNGAIVILFGSFLIGLATGKPGLATVKPFLVDPFNGALCLFLLDLGAQAAKGLRTGWKELTPRLLSFALLMPVTGVVLAGGVAFAAGLDAGNTMLLMTLAASASYIAVPAAMRFAVPEARPAMSLSLSLGLTFPFNILIGIPLYVAIAGWLAART
ncbi:sodium-dependent bicarbonate transport family permease [Allorhizobium undicola]|uniref:sodium-dependent bicarbonate transport family permease n=1 Tax=Allorhizobium undicola TaxID=78527 RepID=UPI000484651A|nr:sodium-dependent bicarbonate transport family permease [Allorhizobium undicola]